MNCKSLFRNLFIIFLLSFSSHQLAAQCAAAIPYPMSDPCVQIVIANDSFCCNFTWDSICQGDYDDCDPGDGGGGGGPITTSSSTYSVEELVTEVLLGACVSASNITWTGQSSAFGNFSGGNTLGFEEGIILSSGSATDATGPESYYASTSHTTPGDADLDGMLNGITTNDAAILEFDFESPTDFVSFEYVFASEEYAGYTCSTVNDAFGFFITGPGFTPNTNVALVPGTNTPVSINTVNQGFPSGWNSESNCTDLDPNYSDYSVYYNNNGGGVEISYAGYTDVFTVELELQPCETYHIKLVIADGGDHILDSSVFLKAGSFTSGLEVEVIPGTSNATQDALEGCQDGYFMFINQGPSVTEPTDFNFNIGGSATMGDDYAPIDESITFMPGQDTVIINIEAFLDGIDEGPEDIILSFPDICSCDEAPEAVLNIIDNNELVAEISDDVTICEGSDATIEVVIAEGSNSEPYSYLWSNGATTPEITVSPAVTTTYTVEVSDACMGQAIELSATVTVGTEIITDFDEQVCAGSSYTLPDGSTTTDEGTYTFNYVTPEGCDSIVNINLTLLEIEPTVTEASICDGETYTLPDGTTANSAGDHTVTLASYIGCDSVVTTNLSVLPVYEQEENVAVCEGAEYVLPDGSSVDVAGSYPIVFESVDGCDSTVVYNLELYPVYDEYVNVAICGDNGYTLPDGSVVTDPGEYEVTLASVHGCDSVVTYTLGFQGLTSYSYNAIICNFETYEFPDGSSTQTAGDYEILIDGNGCDTLYNISLEVIPAFEETQKDTICSGEEYLLPNGTIVTETGIYSIAHTSQNGCDSTFYYDLLVVPSPEASVSAHPEYLSVYDNSDVKFFNHSANATHILWDFDSLGQFQIDNPIVDFNGQVGSYPVCLTVTNDFGCEDQSCFIYEVREDFAVYIPTAFSPNEDGINDLFFVQGRDIDPNNFQLQIFNRQGEVVFETNDPEVKWDGSEPAHEYYAQNEVYVYRVVIGSAQTAETKEFTGTVTAIR